MTKCSQKILGSLCKYSYSGNMVLWPTPSTYSSPPIGGIAESQSDSTCMGCRSEPSFYHDRSKSTALAYTYHSQGELGIPGDIRGEMIRLELRYAWLDVLCLRQQVQPALGRDLAIPANEEVMERWEQRRLEEWKPTIGAIYSYAEGQTVIFMSGCGRPFRAGGWASERHWLRRAWTLQEAPVLNRCLIAGLPGGTNYEWDSGINSGSLWPWNCKVYDFI